MRIACLGGGPAGLYFAIAMKLRDPGHEIVVVERNRPDDTFGWGVVLSDETLGNLEAQRPRERRRRSARAFAYWDDIAVHLPRHTSLRSGGHGFCGIGRKRLLNILQDRARGARRRAALRDRDRRPRGLSRDYDLIVAADGVNSKVRGRARARLPARHRRARLQVHLARHAPEVRRRLHLHLRGDASTAGSGRTPTSSMPTPRPSSSSARRRPGGASGFDRMSQDETIAACERDLRQLPRRPSADDQRPAPARLGLAQLQPRAVRALAPRERRADGRCRGHRAFLGRLRHQAGDGERHRARRVPAHRADHGRRPSRATRTSGASRCCGCRARRATRPSGSSRSSATCISIRCSSTIRCSPARSASATRTCACATRRGSTGAETWFEEQATGEQARRARGRRCSRRSGCASCDSKNRVVVSPMAQYRAVDGTPTDWHLVHYAERAKGGAGLVYHRDDLRLAEGRITPGCTGLYAAEHEAAWKRIVDFVHAETDAKIAHAARPLRAQGLDPARLGDDGRAAAERQLAGHGAVAGAVVAGQPGAARDDARRHGRGARRSSCARPRWPSAPASTCSSCTPPTATCCRPSSRRSPTGAPTSTAAALENRMRFPLEVFHAVRAVWPEGKPMSVRISANDWVGDDGITPEDAVAIARMLRAAGADIIDVSAGQTSHRCAARLRPHVPDAVLRPHPQRGRHRHHGGRQHLRARPRQLDPDGRPRRPVLPGAAASGRPYWTLHAAAAAGLRRRELAASPIWPAAISCIGWPARRRQPRSGCDGAIARRAEHALITGGGTGIGAAIARALAGAGAAVSVAGRRAGPLEEVAARLPRAKAIVADVTSEADCAAMVAAARAATGPSTSSSPMPARPRARRSRKLDLAHWQRMLDVNLTGAFLTVGRRCRISRGARRAGPHRLHRLHRRPQGLRLRRRPTARPSTASSAWPARWRPSWRRAASRSTPSAPASPRRRCWRPRSPISPPRPAARALMPKPTSSASTRRAGSSRRRKSRETVLWLCSPAAQAITGQAISVSGGET